MMKERIKGMQHIGLPTNDMKATIAFYESLGFEIATRHINNGEDVVFLTLGNICIETYENGKAFILNYNNSSYRHITNYYEQGRDEWMLVEPNSIIDIQFNAYIFSGSEPNLASTYWSNIPATISAIEASNKHQYDKLIWSTDPLTVRLGRGEVIEGLEAALIGCRDQDSVQVYMTSQAAYGKHIIGSVPKNSPVAWYIKILSVTR